LGQEKPKGLKGIAKIGYGHLCLRVENLCLKVFTHGYLYHIRSSYFKDVYKIICPGILTELYNCLRNINSFGWGMVVAWNLHAKYCYKSSEISWDWSTSLRTLTQASVNVREPRRAKSRMDNPEKLGTVGTQDTGRRQTKQQQ